MTIQKAQRNIEGAAFNRLAAEALFYRLRAMWGDPLGYFTPGHPAFDYRPSPEERGQMAALETERRRHERTARRKERRQATVAELIDISIDP